MKAVQKMKQKTPLVSAIALQLVIGTLFSIGSLFLFLVLSEDVVSKELLTIDTTISQFIYNFRTPELNQIMLMISFLGGEFLLVASALCIAFLAWKNHTKEAFLFLFIVLSGFLINHLTKALFHIPRPDISPIYQETFYSFPSAHAMNSCIFYATLAYFIYHFTKRKTLSAVVGFLCLLLILLIGFSRIYLGVHYPSDVLAGFIAGFWWVVTAILIDKTRIVYKLFQSK